MSLKGDVIAIGVAGVVLIAASWLAKRKLTQAGSAAANAVNPFNNDNVINQGAQSIWQAVTGSTGTIGGDIYDYFHPSNTQPVQNPYTLPPGFGVIDGANWDD